MEDETPPWGGVENERMMVISDNKKRLQWHLLNRLIRIVVQCPPPPRSLFPLTGGWGMEGNLFGTWVTLHADQYSDGKVFAPTQEPNQTLNTNADRVRRKRKKEK